MIVTVTPNPGLDRTLTVPRIVSNQMMRATASRLDWGGKGFNVSRALQALGVDSVAMGFIGGATGRVLERGLSDLGIAADLVPIAGETRTNTVITDAEQYIKVNEAGPTVQAEEVTAFLDRARERVRPGDVWVLSGSLPPGAPSDFYAQLVALLQAKGAKALLDSSGEPLLLGCAASPYLVKPNVIEAEEVTGQAVGPGADALDAAEFFLRQGIELVALSLGADGLLLASQQEAMWARPPRVQARNPVGAGDALLAGIAWALAGLEHRHRACPERSQEERRLPLEELARWGVAAGTAAAMREGVSVGTRAEVEALYKQVQTVPLERSAHRDAGLPPPLMTSDPGSFARFTITERKPQIIRQVIEDNSYPPGIVKALEALGQELAGQPIRPLTEQASDVARWNRELAAYRGRTWLDVPWYFAEAYLYRRLLEAVRYFQPGPWQGHDPFGRQKHQQEEMAVKRLAADWGQLADAEPGVAFEALLHSCLWGNRVDLSKYTVAMQAPTGLAVCEERHHILIDHTNAALELVAGGLHQVDFVNDNVGVDLLFDLALADFVLLHGWVQEVIFHLKDRPFFVSDAMPTDARATISLLQAAPDPAVQELGARMHDHVEAGRLMLKDDPFWTSSLMFRHMPPSLRAELARSDLIILKGDVNYRRLLADRHWPHTARLEEIAAYFPAPFLVLRTLKAEVVVGLRSSQAAALTAEDPTWLVNGKRGIIQLMNRRNKETWKRQP